MNEREKSEEIRLTQILMLIRTILAVILAFNDTRIKSFLDDIFKATSGVKGN